ncbi:acyl-ACP--UDP-N-acetylglucosamine O-acyltransferase [Verrucomicrobiaceae bacterium 227]
MPSIHPTALVSENTTLAEDVEIGPFAIIEEHVALGAGCKIDSHAKICSGVTMGAGNSVGHGAVIGGHPQDLAFDPTMKTGVLIGEGNTFREHVTINRSTREGGNTIVGDRNFLMAVSHLGHDVQIGDDNAIANNVMVAGHCKLANRIFLGGGAAIHQFIHIGDFAMVQGNAGMTRDIPPYCIVHQINLLSGLNVIGMRRAGFSAEERSEIKKVYNLLLASKKTRSEALAEVDQSNWSKGARVLIEAVRNPSSKGILTR